MKTQAKQKQNIHRRQQNRNNRETKREQEQNKNTTRTTQKRKNTQRIGKLINKRLQKIIKLKQN